MKHRLIHGPDFTMSDGPLAGRTFRRGETYDEVPANMADRFDTIEPAETKKPKRGGSKK